jgi:hypothetical protein
MIIPLFAWETSFRRDNAKNRTIALKINLVMSRHEYSSTSILEGM